MTDDDPLKHKHAVHVRGADYVTVDMKRLTAERMAGWLEDAADVYDIGGASTSAGHARAVARQLRRKVEVSDDGA